MSDGNCLKQRSFGAACGSYNDKDIQVHSITRVSGRVAVPCIQVCIFVWYSYSYIVRPWSPSLLAYLYILPIC